MSRLKLRRVFERMLPQGIALLLFLTCYTTFALRTLGQTSLASVNGTVTDAAGVVVPGSTVVLVNSATGARRTVATNAEGVYSVLDGSPGRYTLEVAKQGFATYKQTEFTLLVNQTATFNFTLSMGATTQKVNVAAQSDRVEFSTAELGTAISEEQVNDLPLNGRNFTQLLTLAPGMSPANVSQNGGRFWS